MEQSEHTQRELIVVTRSSLQKMDSHYQPVQDNDRMAVSAFIEYLQAFREDVGKGSNVPFDTGLYYVSNTGLSDAIYFLAFLANESLRKKTLARLGRKLMGDAGLQGLMRSISSYLGFYNIAIAGYDDRAFSLASLLDQRPAGLLSPLTDAEWSELSEKAVAAMLERRQIEEYLYNGYKTSYRDNESETNFRDQRYNKNCAFLGTPKKYSFANSEAKQAAQVLVTTEKVRLTLFLEALQGTLRFLDQLSRLPQYQEVQVSFMNETDKKVVAKGLIALLTTLVETGGAGQEEPALKNEQDNRIVESDGSHPSTAVLQIRKAEHRDNLHTYNLSLTDGAYLSETILFLLQVSEDGETQLFEDEGNG